MYYSTKTSNISFLKMHKYLKGQGIKNNKFFLKLYDLSLDGIDPYDPNLDVETKAAILLECTKNYWYFIREVVRIPHNGTNIPYVLHRGNLAMNYGFEYNLNMFVEFSRLNYLTISALCRYLWVFNIKGSNCNIRFNDKKHDASKFSLYRIKELRKCLPVYLRMEGGYDNNGMAITPRASIDMLKNPLNNNTIKATPSARNENAADSLGESSIQPLQWYNDFSFIKYNKRIYEKSLPIFTATCFKHMMKNLPYGILITTTPNKMNTKCGADAYDIKQNAAIFIEELYDLNEESVREYIKKYSTNNFLNLKFLYSDLEKDEKWFDKMSAMLNHESDTIRRELLLEWF